MAASRLGMKRRSSVRASDGHRVLSVASTSSDADRNSLISARRRPTRSRSAAESRNGTYCISSVSIAPYARSMACR